MDLCSLWLAAAFVPFQAAGAVPQARSAAAEGATFHLAVTPNLFSNDVSVLDTRTHTEIARIPVGNRPSRVAMSADGQFAYVGEDGGGGSAAIRKIDLGTLREVGVAFLPSRGTFISELEVSPDGRWVIGGTGGGATFHRIQAATMALESSQALCVECDGTQGPLIAGLKVGFTAVGGFAYAATSYVDLLYAIELATGRIVGHVPAPSSGGSSPYGDVKTLDPLGRVSLVSATHNNSLRIFEGVSSTSIDVEFGRLYGNKDVELATDLPLIGTSSILVDPQPDFMRVVDLGARVVRRIPAPETWQNLDYNESLQETWAWAGATVGTFEMATLTQGPDVQVSGGFIGTIPAFTQDEAFYYYPAGTRDEVVVVDARTKLVVTTIAVGDNPRGVYMQGDASPSEF